MGYNIKQRADGGTVLEGGRHEDGLIQEAITLGQRTGFYPNYKRKTHFFDDFLGKAIGGAWTVTAGSDSPAAGAVVVSQLGGWLRLTTGDSNASVAADGVGVNLGLNYKASSGNLVFEAAVKVDVITAAKVFIGFTDTIALEEPFSISTATITSTASDGCGFLFDSAATVTNWQALGVKGDTDTAAVNTGVALVAATWQLFRIVIDNAGSAYFYINDVLVGTLANAVTTTVAITPVIYSRATNTTPKNVDVDYAFISNDRVAIY